MLSIVKEACDFAPDLSRGLVIVQSDITDDFGRAIEELQGPEARNMAIGYAARNGVGDPRINGNLSSPYAINKDGDMLSEVKDKTGKVPPPSHPSMQPARYRVDVPVCRRLV